MIKREFKINLKSFVIWLAILIGLFLVVYLIYPYIINDETLTSLDEMMDMFPEDVLKAFNMDMSSITTAYGWLKSEGFMFVLLIVGIYASFMGGNILLKEESDKTIEYLGTLPIKRRDIVLNKVIVGISYIILIVLLLGIFNYIALTISGDFEHKQFILLSLTPIFIGLPLFALNLFISTFLHKTRSVVGISLGLVMLFYICSVLSELSDNVKFLRYFTIYTLADTRNVIANVTINPLYIGICIVITSLFVILTCFRYDKKELLM